MNFIEELKWRGLLFDTTPETESHLNSGSRAGYIGFDPSAPSLHVGSLMQIMLLVHFQRSGHKPIALIGGATGMIGDPSGKSEERKLLNEETTREYEAKIKNQLGRFLIFDGLNGASLENNYEWYKNLNVLEFLREVGKHLTVNYMMAKDSVKNRLETGISFTEFSYQLLQGYDFFWLNKNRDCTLQMGGSDQWGNIVAGIELTRRKSGNELFAVTSPLVTRADGKKFGKTEEGTIWLDRSMTSPYKFYQFWMNVADEEATKYIRYFTLLEQEEILQIEETHAASPHLHLLQQALAKDITVRVHSEGDYQQAVQASKILFGQTIADELRSLSNRDFEEIFEGVPTKKLSKSDFDPGMDVMKLLVEETQFFPTRGDARRTILGNGASINKQTITLDQVVKADELINDRYLLLQKGKKNYFLVIAE